MMNPTTATIARCIARDAVKDHIWAEGRKLSEFAPHDIKYMATDYLAQHPELFAQAEAMLAKFRSRAQRKRP